MNKTNRLHDWAVILYVWLATRETLTSSKVSIEGPHRFADASGLDMTISKLLDILSGPDASVNSVSATVR